MKEICLAKEPELTLFTVGYSARTLDEFVGLLKTYGITLVVDARTVRRRRHNPQLDKETLPCSLERFGVEYIYMPKIGGCNAF